MALIGFGFTQHLGATNVLLHVLSPPAMRGRVMGVFLTAFIGITPLGGLAVGWLATRMDEVRTRQSGRPTPAARWPWRGSTIGRSASRRDPPAGPSSSTVPTTPRAKAVTDCSMSGGRSARR
jgi:MFS family permease